MTRIKYTRLAGYLVSNDIFVDNDFLNIFISPDEYGYTIYNLRSEEVASGQGKSLRDAKRLAREAIIALGANLKDEVRRRS